MKGDEIDLKGLIADAYRIEGISPEECRAIFFDWALSVPADADTRALITILLDRHGDVGHPMTQVLQDGLQAPTKPKRRGGAMARR